VGRRSKKPVTIPVIERFEIEKMSNEEKTSILHSWLR